mgnify:FL=1
MVKIIERMIFKEDNSLKKKTRKFEVPGKIMGNTMFAEVLNLHGWNLAIKDGDASMIITGKNEAELLELKKLLKETNISFTVLLNQNFMKKLLDDDQ